MRRLILRAVRPIRRPFPVARTLSTTRLYSAPSDFPAAEDRLAWTPPAERAQPEQQEREEEAYNPSLPVKRLPRKYRPFDPPWLVPPPPLSFDPGIDLIALGIPKTSAEEAEIELYKAWRTKEDRARAKKLTEGMHRWRRPPGPGIHRKPDPAATVPEQKRYVSAALLDSSLPSQLAEHL